MTPSSLPPDHADRMERVGLALDGLSVGDAFGQRFFYVPALDFLLDERALPGGPWQYTDDTEMALGIAEVLRRHGRVDPDDLAATFARRYHLAPWRGYGGMAHEILQAIGEGHSWRDVSRAAFDGTGSMGNGGAMRVAPVGAYFADDLNRVADEARASAEVTHAHPEGQAGAIAIAVAAAWAVRRRETSGPSSPADLFAAVLDLTPRGQTRCGIEQARDVPLDYPVGSAVSFLGNGSRVIAPDTVPFCLWSVARHLDDYEEAMWETVSALGDIDTNCAIVGGVVALAVGRAGIPVEWLEAREPLGLQV